MPGTYPLRRPLRVICRPRACRNGLLCQLVMASGFATLSARSEVNSLRRVFRWVTAMGECDCECDSHYYEHSGASFSARTRGACRLAAQRLWRHYATFKELIEKTNWNSYGYKSGNTKCSDCMVHCGYEPTAAMAAMQLENIPQVVGSLFKIGA